MLILRSRVSVVSCPNGKITELVKGNKLRRTLHVSFGGTATLLAGQAESVDGTHEFFDNAMIIPIGAGKGMWRDFDSCSCHTGDLVQSAISCKNREGVDIKCWIIEGLEDDSQ